MDDKAEAFAECLLGDIFGCFSEAMNLNVEFLSEQDESRFVPEEFYCVIISFSKVFVDELMPEISIMPVWYYFNEIFFKRFTNSVCLKLMQDDKPEVAFLKVMAFLMLIISSSFINRCYRSIDHIPTILKTLLKEHLKTKFYEEDRFEEILSQCDELKDNEKWCESTVEEMRSCIKGTLSEELAVTEAVTAATDFAFRPEMCKIRIIDVRLQSLKADSDSKYCPYCSAECFFFLKEFWKPKIVYKPGCQQM